MLNMAYPQPLYVSQIGIVFTIIAGGGGQGKSCTIAGG